MKRGQIIGLVIAGFAGLIAFIGMQSLVNQEPKTIVEEKMLGAVDVLVARTKLRLGEIASPTHLAWKKWPKDSLGAGYITKASKPNAIQYFTGGIARTMILSDEPITENKLIRSGKGGVLSAILPKGKRAISTKITDISAAGRLILPNDHVDVLLTTRDSGGKGSDAFVTETVFRNVRVLAVGKKLNVVNKENGADGSVATLELTPQQTEIMARANTIGQISLALRSVADINEDTADDALLLKKQTDSSVKLLQYNIKHRAYVVN